MPDDGLADVLARLGLGIAGLQARSSDVRPRDAETAPTHPAPTSSSSRADELKVEAHSSPLDNASLREALDEGATLQSVIASSGMPAGRARRQLLKECFGVDVPPRASLPTRVEAERLLELHGAAILRATARTGNELEDARALGLEEWALGWLVLIHRDRDRAVRVGARRVLNGSTLTDSLEGSGGSSPGDAAAMRPWPGRPRTPIERRASAAYLQGAGIIGIAAEVGISAEAAFAALLRGVAGVAVSETPAVEPVDLPADAARVAVSEFDAGKSIGAIARSLDQPQTVVAWLLLAHSSGRMRALA